MTNELSAEQEAVRGLLSQARHEEPMPPDVAARLETTLAELANGTRARPSRMAAALTDLNAVRRRRRNAGRILLAAAAVVVGGAALGQSVDGLGGPGDDATSADTAEGTLAEVPRDGTELNDRDAAGGGEAAPGAAGAYESGSVQDQSAPTSADIDAAQLLAEVRLPAQLTSADFESDVKGLFRRATDEREAAAKQRLDLTKQYADASEYDCDNGPYGRGALLPVYYDQAPAVLALRPSQGDSQRIDLLECGSGLPLNTVTLTRDQP